jgi:DNA processing protein
MARVDDEWIRLAHVGMHPDRLRSLATEAGGPGPVLQSIIDGRVAVPENARQAARVAAGERRAALAAGGVAFVPRDSPRFPVLLTEVEDAPYFLFVRGALPEVPAIGIVGTRRCTRYGRDLARTFGAAVSQAGWSVVSGLARGIDGEAHRGSLQGHTPGVAVLGCGIDRWYPTSHAELGQGLLDSGGAVISEYPPGTPPTGWRFPPRNRIISGMCRAVVIVEAAVTGGALITAQRALEQDRVIFAVPGDVTRPSSEGCNLLIRDGAVPILGPEDLIEGLSFVLGPPAEPGPIEVARAEIAGMEVPPLGAGVEELALTAGIGVPELLVELGGLVATGAVELRDGRVYPR